MQAEIYSPPELLTTPQAAKYLGVSPGYLANDRCTTARIPFIRLGRRAIRYCLADLNGFLDERRVRSTSQYHDLDRPKPGKQKA